MIAHNTSKKWLRRDHFFCIFCLHHLSVHGLDHPPLGPICRGCNSRFAPITFCLKPKLLELTIIQYRAFTPWFGSFSRMMNPGSQLSRGSASAGVPASSTNSSTSSSYSTPQPTGKQGPIPRLRVSAGTPLPPASSMPQPNMHNFSGGRGLPQIVPASEEMDDASPDGSPASSGGAAASSPRYNGGVAPPHPPNAASSPRAAAPQNHYSLKRPKEGG